MLVTLFLMQAKMPLAFLITWTQWWLVPASTPWSFSVRQLSSHSCHTNITSWHKVVMTQVQHPGLTLVECSANDGDAWTQILSCMSQNFSRSQGKISVWFTAVGQQLLRKTTFSTCCFLGQGADHKIELTSMQETSTGLHLHYTTLHCAAAIGMTR